MIETTPILFQYQHFIFVKYGLWMALGFVASSIVCIHHITRTLGPQDIAYLPLSILSWSILGARLFSLIFEDGLSGLRVSPLRSIFRPGFWLHGGLAFLLWGLYANRAYVSNPWVFFDGAGIGLPIYEALSRMGCHSYGCCFGKQLDSDTDGIYVKYFDEAFSVIRIRPHFKGVKLFPVQAISAVMFFVQFLVVFAASMFTLKPGFLFGISLLIHALIRLVTEQWRDDPRGTETGLKVMGMRFILSTTGIFAVAQIVTAMAVLLMVDERAQFPVPRVSHSLSNLLIDPNVLFSHLLLFGMVSFVYGYHYKSVGRWI